MGKTIIKIECKDQKLHLLNPTVIASGGRNEDLVEFSFCPLWDGFEKYVAFYRNRRTVYRVPIVDNQCIIPQEVLAEGGWISIAVFGTNGDILRTSDELKYHIKPGAPTSGIDPSEPTPDLWEQVLLNRGATTWDDLGTEIVNDYLLPEVTVAVQEESGGATLPDFAANVTKGQIYKITYNGAEYECVAHSDELFGGEGNSFLFGNVGALIGGDDTGEPFIINAFQPGSDIGNSMMPLDGSTSVTVSIYGKMEKVVPLPEKYMPITSVYFVKIRKNSDGYTLLNGSFEEIVKAFNAGRSVCLDIDRELMSGAPLCGLTGDRAFFMSVETINSLNFVLGIFEITLDNKLIFRKFKPSGEFV